MKSLNEFLSHNGLHLQMTNVKEKYLCKMCLRIMCEPKIFKKCSDSFCGKCIDSYMNDGHQNCPSCHTRVNMDEDLHPDVRINNKILDLIIECPHTQCEERIAIGQMETNLRNCNKRIVNCVLHVLGCVDVLTQETSHSHISENIDAHLSLIVKKISEKDLSIEALRNKNVQICERIGATVNEINNTRDDQESTKVELQRTKANLDSTKDELQCTKVDLQRTKANLVSAKDEIENLTQTFNHQLNQIKSAIEEERENNKRVVEDLKEKINQSCNIKVKQDETAKKEMVQLKKSYEEAHDREFQLEFDNIRQREKCRDYWSQTFQICQYSFKIRMYIWIENRIHFYLHSVRAANMYCLNWPIPFNMSIEVIHGDKIQPCYISYTNTKLKKDYDKPERDIRKISDSWIELRDLSSLPNKCSIKVKRI